MKTIIFLLLAFNSFAQDTIPCDMTRQQSRLYFGVLADRVALDKAKAKLFDDQHKRSTTKEIKSFKYQIKTLRFEKQTFTRQLKSNERMYNDRLDFVSDSLKLDSKTKRKITKDSTDLIEKRLKGDIKIKAKELNKQVNRNSLVWWIGIVLSLGLVLVIVVVFKR